MDRECCAHDLSRSQSVTALRLLVASVVVVHWNMGEGKCLQQVDAEPLQYVKSYRPRLSLCFVPSQRNPSCWFRKNSNSAGPMDALPAASMSETMAHRLSDQLALVNQAIHCNHGFLKRQAM